MGATSQERTCLRPIVYHITLECSGRRPRCRGDCNIVPSRCPTVNQNRIKRTLGKQTCPVLSRMYISNPSQSILGFLRESPLIHQLFRTITSNSACDNPERSGIWGNPEAYAYRLETRCHQPQLFLPLIVDHQMIPALVYAIHMDQHGRWTS